MTSKADLEPRASVWRCAACNHVDVAEEFEDWEGHLCPVCDSEDVFPALDGEWCASRARPKTPLSPDEKATLDAFNRDLVGKSFKLGPGVYDLIQLRGRVQKFVNFRVENEWSRAIYERARREGHDVVPWVTKEYEKALERLEAGGPLQIAGES